MIGSYRVGDMNPAWSKYGESVSFKGDDTPKQLRRKGLWPVNRFEKSKSLILQSTSPITWWNGSPAWPEEGLYPYRILNPQVSGLPGPDSSVVLSKLAGKWRDTDLNIGMYLSPEGRESAEMIFHSLKRLSNAAHALKRGNFGDFARNLNDLPRSARKRSARAFNQGDLSGSFLAAHLGWEPLIKDVYGLSDNIGDIGSPIRRISAQVKVKGYNITFSSDALKSKCKAKVVTNKSQLRYTLDTRVSPTFAQRFGLDNPFLIAWELVPLSFVADYFLPIGSTIDALAFVSNVKGKGFIKQYSEYRYNISVPKRWVFPTGDRITSRESTALLSSSYFKRTPWVPNFSDPLRSLNVKLPTSLMKVSTMAALTHQRILALAKK